jgi:orotate phosphoribosyltransferase
MMMLQGNRLLEIAALMNARLKALSPSMEEDVFTADILFDGSYLTLSGTEKVEKKVIRKVASEFRGQIRKTIKYPDPISEYESELVSLLMLRTGVFRFDSIEPTELGDGSLSPIYFNLANLWDNPEATGIVCSIMREALKDIECTVIVGGELRGVPFAVHTATLMGKKYSAVRKNKKGYGLGLGVEGGVKKGDMAVILDDMITFGAGKIPFIKHVGEKEARIVAVAVVFDRQQGGKRLLEELYHTRLISLTDMQTFLKVALKFGYISRNDHNIVLGYLSNPKKWSDEKKKALKKKQIEET